MKNKVIDYLQISSEEYDDRLFQLYFNWCQKWATADNNQQMLLANTKVSNWFMLQFSNLEKQFIEMVEHFPHALSNMEYHYNGFIVQVFNLHPKALIDCMNKKYEVNLTLRLTENNKIYAN